jgi:very-short-patch-repair endonuclease
MRQGQKRDSARALRRNATDAERMIGRLLRDRRLRGKRIEQAAALTPTLSRKRERE